MSSLLNNEQHQGGQIILSRKQLAILFIFLLGLLSLPVVFFYTSQNQEEEKPAIQSPVVYGKTGVSNYWIAPLVDTIYDDLVKEQIAYGKDLVAHTAKYFGPNGSISKTTNGLNCQNCHLQAGTGVFANNYGAVASLYPKLRARSGTVESINKRVNDCFERSLNGKTIDTTGNEMVAIVAYINFLGSNVPKGAKAPGSGFKELAYINRAADPVKGKIVYVAKCQSCHQSNGEGLLNVEKTEFAFPALWGNQSYNDGAGLYRLSNFAKFVKYNMPQGTTFENPQLTDEEAWDVAAFVNTQKRPHIKVPADWPDKSKKPIDHPFGPYADQFTQQQHKFGPFQPIEAATKDKPTLLNK